MNEHFAGWVRRLLLFPSLAALSVIALFFLLATIRPDNLWERSKAYVAYRPADPDFRPLIVWDADNQDYKQIYHILAAVRERSYAPTVLVPAERNVHLRFGFYFVNSDGAVQLSGYRNGEFTDVDPRILVERILKDDNRIIYKDEASLREILRRLPKLQKVGPFEKFVKKGSSPGFRPLLSSFSLTDDLWMAGRLGAMVWIFVALVLLVRDRLFGRVEVVAGWVLGAGLVLSVGVLVLWVCAEFGLLYWGWLLGILFLGTVLGALVGQAPVTKTGKVPLRIWGILSALFLFCLLANFLNPRFSFDSDLQRPLNQGKLLHDQSGWDRKDILMAAERHAYAYPYAAGILYDGLFTLAGLEKGQWPPVDVRFSTVVLLNQMTFALLCALSLAAFADPSKGRRSFLVACCLCLPTYWGTILGTEGIVWPIFLLLLLGLKPPPGVQPWAQWTYCLAVAGTLSLIKHDAGPQLLLLILPWAGTEAVLSKQWRPILPVLGVCILGLAPLAVFEFLNHRAGINGLDDFDPVNWDNFRKDIPQLPGILEAQFRFLATWKPSIPIYVMLLVGIYLRIRDGEWDRKDWVGLMVPLGIFYFFWSGVYIFSHIQSPVDHVHDTFNRLWAPALILAAFKVFYLTGPADGKGWKPERKGGS